MTHWRGDGSGGNCVIIDNDGGRPADGREVRTLLIVRRTFSRIFYAYIYT